MSRHPLAGERAVRRAAIARTLQLAVTMLALLAIAGCSGTLAPIAETAAPPATSAAVTAPVIAPSPTTVPKPTATFVPLITPSPTAADNALIKSTVPRIDIEAARRMADAGEAVLVDVRTTATYEQAHIAGAISMPSSEILDRYHELPADKLIIFY